MPRSTAARRALLSVLLALLAGASRSLAAPPPDLIAAAAKVRQIPASKGREPESARLRRFFDLYWSIRMLQAPTLATYVGYPGLNDRWPDYSPEGEAFAKSIVRDEIAALASIDRAPLTPTERTDAELARLRLAGGIEGERFTDLVDALAIDSMGGVDLELMNLMDFAPVRTPTDFEAILSRLRGFPRVVDDTLDALRRGLARGITPPKATLRAVPDRVASLIADDPWKSRVLGPFQTLPETIPAADRDRLRGEAARVYTSSVLPALKKLHTYLAETYVPGAQESVAMTALPGGAEFYALQLRTYTTTDLSPEEIYQLGLREVARIEREMETAISATGFQGTRAELTKYLRTDPRFYFDRPEEMLAAYRDITKRVDPGLAKLFGRLPRLPYGVKEMDGEGAKTAPAAYYSNGNLANGQPGWFLVNTYDLKARPKWSMEALALHEAVPGHHLQYSLAAELDELPEWRKWDVYPAFGEGWGLYAESLGSELGLYRDPYSRIGQLTNEIWRAIRLVADPGIHLKGWSRQEAIDYYRAHCAKSDHEIQAEVDRIIVQPGTVPAYKVGELKIREIRAYAEKELGAEFDIRAFHDHLLGRGQLPLGFLEREMKAWVGEEKARLSQRRETSQPKGAPEPTP